MTILKAALNHGLKARRIANDDAWRQVQRFGEVDAARPRYLSDDEARRSPRRRSPRSGRKYSARRALSRLVPTGLPPAS